MKVRLVRTGETSDERPRDREGNFSKNGSGKSASSGLPLRGLVRAYRAVGRPAGRYLYRRRPGRSSGKSNNATCRFRLIYSRGTLAGRALDMQSTPCHLLPSRPDRLTLRSVRENVDVRTRIGERETYATPTRRATLTSFFRFHFFGPA